MINHIIPGNVFFCTVNVFICDFFLLRLVLSFCFCSVNVPPVTAISVIKVFVVMSICLILRTFRLFRGITAFCIVGVNRFRCTVTYMLRRALLTDSWVLTFCFCLVISSFIVVIIVRAAGSCIPAISTIDDSFCSLKKCTF